jgi:hypothetical protein
LSHELESPASAVHSESTVRYVWKPKDINGAEFGVNCLEKAGDMDGPIANITKASRPIA